MDHTEHNSDVDRYVEFLRTKGHPDSSVFLHNLYDYLVTRAAEVLDSETIRALADSEEAGDPHRFIELFMATKPKAEITTGNFLYHRWIRMLTLLKYPPEKRETIESIPIAFIPFYPILDAFITKTPYGNIICFTHGLNTVLLSVFLTMAKSARFQRYAPKKTQLSAGEAEDRIIALARFVLGGCQRKHFPPRLDLEDRVVQMADVLNNITHTFILAHEYNHFLLGHLRNTRPGAGIVSQGNFRHIESFSTDLQQEVEADLFAVRLLRESNTTPDGNQHNANLCSGVYAYFLFNDICKKLLGCGEGASPDHQHRIAKILESVFEDTDRVYILEEVNILGEALDKI